MVGFGVGCCEVKLGIVCFGELYECWFNFLISVVFVVNFGICWLIVGCIEVGVVLSSEVEGWEL